MARGRLVLSLLVALAVPIPRLTAQSVTPTSGSVTVTPNSSGNQVVFTVTTGGAAQFGWSVSCTYNPQVTSCSYPPPNLNGGSAQVTVTFSVGGVGLGDVGLELYDGPFLVASGRYDVQVGNTYGVAVTPDGGSLTTPANTSGNSATFTVQNTGNGSNTFTFTCASSGSVTGCTPPASVTLSAGVSTNRTATYSTGGGGTGTVTLTASGTGTSDQGYYTVTVPIVNGVSVTPDGGSLTTPASTSGNPATFTVLNTGNVSNTFSFACARTGSVTGCTPPASVTLAAGASTGRTVTYNTGSPGSGTVTLTASGTGASDTGNYVVTVSAGVNAPLVALYNHNRDHHDRALCITAAAGDDAVVQCGDLRVTHGMPAFRSLSRDRALTLVYNSATAAPRPRVAARVQVQSTAPQPQSIYAELTVGGVVRASGSYAGWAPGATRQVVLAFDASALATGWYPFTLLTRSVYPSATYDASINDTLIVVNRADSTFGAGWYLGGVERLVLAQPGDAILWVGGDGSARVYRSITPNQQWQGPLGSYRDLIVRVGTTYERRAKYGVTVTFDQTGRHIQTRNRLGHVTTFVWDANGRLVQIIAPGAAGGS